MASFTSSSTKNKKGGRDYSINLKETLTFGSGVSARRSWGGSGSGYRSRAAAEAAALTQARAETTAKKLQAKQQLRQEQAKQKQRARAAKAYQGYSQNEQIPNYQKTREEDDKIIYGPGSENEKSSFTSISFREPTIPEKAALEASSFLSRAVENIAISGSNIFSGDNQELKYTPVVDFFESVEKSSIKPGSEFMKETRETDPKEVYLTGLGEVALAISPAIIAKGIQSAANVAAESKLLKTGAKLVKDI